MGNIKRTAAKYELYLVKPQEKKDAHAFAERLAALESVDEVVLTEGEYGYLVKVRDSDKSFSKAFGEHDRLQCHCIYKSV